MEIRTPEPVKQTPVRTPVSKPVEPAPVVPKPSEPVKAETPKPAANPASGKKFDFSAIDPEKEWECFGTFDGKHSECQECPFAKQCEEKKNAKK